MLNIKNILLFALFIFTSTILFAQDKIVASSDSSFMASEGKIYVVMVVVLTILAGLILFLFRLEFKLKKLEKSGANN